MRQNRNVCTARTMHCSKTFSIRCVRNALPELGTQPDVPFINSQTCTYNTHTHNHSHTPKRTHNRMRRKLSISGNVRSRLCAHIPTPRLYQLYANLIKLNKQSDQAHMHTHTNTLPHPLAHTFALTHTGIQFYINESRIYPLFFFSERANLRSFTPSPHCNPVPVVIELQRSHPLPKLIMLRMTCPN